MAEDKVGVVMREYKHGKLHSGSDEGPKVKSRAQAIAIGLSEARKAGQNVSPKPKEGSVKGHGSHHHGIPHDPKHHSMGYSHLRLNEGAQGPVKQDPVTSMEASKGKELHPAKHTHLRSKGNFDPGTTAEAEHHVGDHEGGHPRGPEKAAHNGLEAHHHSDGVRAEHHPPVSGEPHRISRPPAGPTSGFGHAAHQRSGHL